MDAPARDTLSHALRKVVAASGLTHVISGVPYIRTQYVEMISSELAFFLSISIFLAIVVMFWLFRSWWGVLLPLVGVGISMAWTFGLMAATGRPLDIIGELLPTVLFVCGVTTSSLGDPLSARSANRFECQGRDANNPQGNWRACCSPPSPPPSDL
ncbi:MAG: MMPL family transporter [Bacteroidetes bacterium]|nr:MMPL family transporter [Bacteroidota bacterium]